MPCETGAGDASASSVPVSVQYSSDESGGEIILHGFGVQIALGLTQ